MAAKKARRKYRKNSTDKQAIAPKYCSAPIEKSREFSPDISNDRSSLIILSGNKWVAGTVLHYYFFNSPSKWKGTAAQIQRTKDAFQIWADQNIGLEFREVFFPHEAEIRIGFQNNDGHWSYLGGVFYSMARPSAL